MMRTLGGFLRGSHAPIQVFLAALLGALLGFVPGFSTAPGLVVTLIVLLLVLNASLPLALFTFGVSKLLSLLAMPVSFAVGEVLLEGPTRGFMELLVNAPVLALWGLDHYVVTGGLVIGAAFGAVLGLLLIRALRAFRARMSRLEANSERYKKVTSAPGMRLLLFVLVGKGHGKKTYAQMLEAQSRRPIRWVGAGLAALLLAALVFVPGLMGGVITEVSRSNLARWNGATVDLEAVDLDIPNNKLVVTGLAMADPNALGSNLFQAARLEANLSSADLLRGKLAIDRLMVVDGAQGLPRETPGEIVGPPPSPAPTPPATEPDARSLEEVLADAKQWRERLATVREWLERLAPEEEDAEREETLAERLEREVAEKGWRGVVSRGLVRDAPALLIREIVADGVRTAQLQGETLDLRFDNLSTHPNLLQAPPRLRVTSSGGTLEVDVALGGASAEAGANNLLFALNGLATEAIAGSLRVDGKPLLSGGSIDLRLDGGWANGRVGWLDLPLTVDFHDVLLSLGGQQQRLDAVSLPIAVRGPIDGPRVTLDDDALASMLEGALRAEFEQRVDAKKQEAVDEVKQKAKQELGGKLGDELGGALGGLLGGDDDGDENGEKKKKKKQKDGDGQGGGGQGGG